MPSGEHSVTSRNDRAIAIGVVVGKPIRLWSIRSMAYIRNSVFRNRQSRILLPILRICSSRMWLRTLSRDVGHPMNGICRTVDCGKKRRPSFDRRSASSAPPPPSPSFAVIAFLTQINYNSRAPHGAARRVCVLSTLLSIIICKRLIENASASRAKLRRKIRVLISNNYARLSTCLSM